MSRSGALAQIDTLLAAISDPAFVAVYRGEPLAISGTPVLAFWVTGRRNDFETLGDIGSRTTVMVRAYFRMQDSPDVRESIELAVWDAMVQIDTQLRSDADLGGQRDGQQPRPCDSRIHQHERGSIPHRLGAIRDGDIRRGHDHALDAPGTPHRGVIAGGIYG